jgi:hypothetical protein
MTTIALTAASATTGLGVMALMVTKWRTLRRWLGGSH